MVVPYGDTMIFVAFVYGLAFYSLGIALWIESGRASRLRFAHSLRLLSAFGILHGIHEWMNMLNCACEIFTISLPLWFDWFRLIILIVSFIALVAFGEHMINNHEGQPINWYIVSGLLVFYGGSSVLVQLVYHMDDVNWRIAMEALARYVLAIPGILLSCLALWRQRPVFLRSNLNEFVVWLNWSIGALLLYGLIGQIFTLDSRIFPANLINSSMFLAVFGFPVQLFRAVLGCVIAISLIQVLRAIEVESQENVRAIEAQKRQVEQQRKQELEQLNAELQQSQIETERLLREVQQRNTQRGDMLMYITSAQEAERQRIARELHDDTGQVLTALAMGLRGLAHALQQKPENAAERLAMLENIATTAIADLRHLINDLRPPQLDDMGLVAALRSMRERLQNRDDAPIIIIQVKGETAKIPVEKETTLYRIAQEAVTNAIKHANARRIEITLNFQDTCELRITDDGEGFDIDKTLQPRQNRSAWGLYGIIERTRLIDATIDIQSEPGQGTGICVYFCKPDSEK